MLEAIGLSPHDETVYDALVRNTQASVADLVRDCHLSAPTVRRSLQSLVRLGLATRSAGRPVTYVAVSPDSGLEAVLRRREQALDEVRTHTKVLMDLYRAGARFTYPGELVEVVSGRDEVNHTWARMQRDTRTQVRGFDRPPYAAPHGHAEPNPIELDLLQRGVRYRVIYDNTVVALPGWLENVLVGVRRGEQARISPDLPMKLAVSDDRLAIIPLLRPGASVVTASYLIHPSPLLDALIALFEALWQRSVPLSAPGVPANGVPALGVSGAVPQGIGGTPAAVPGSGAPVTSASGSGPLTAGIAGAGEDELSDAEARLLTLLAAGATDKTAGRALGWSERTVQRHVTRLMRRLGAQTRFQIAMQATRRGWI